MSKKTNVAEFSLTLKDETYKGETYTKLVGSFEKGGETIIISISTDKAGNPKFYESKKGNHFIYARAVAFRTAARGERKRNKMS